MLSRFLAVNADGARAVVNAPGRGRRRGRWIIHPKRGAAGKGVLGRWKSPCGKVVPAGMPSVLYASSQAGAVAVRRTDRPGFLNFPLSSD